MGNYIVKAGLILDERDFGNEQYPTFESLAENIYNHVAAEFGNSDPQMDDTPPWLEIDGIVSERFDTSKFYTSKCSMKWILPNQGLRAALLSQCLWLGLPNPEELIDLAAEAPEAAQSRLQKAVEEAIKSGEYYSAERLMSALADSASTGIPGVRSSGHFSCDGDDEFFDFREKHYQPGTRILVEVGFNWGQ